jgi:hypothetical protein
MRHLSFVSFGAENGRPPFDPQDPVEHFYQVRDLWASGKSRF